MTTDCCIAGGGPAGMMLGLLLARQGVEVVVMESQADFRRDFRGDTVHPSTLDLMDQLGLGEQLRSLPHNITRSLDLETPKGPVRLVDFSRLPGPHNYLMFVPQWDFLELLAGEGRHHPGFNLMLRAAVSELVVEDGVVTGVVAGTPQGRLRVRAALVVGADGRSSRLRELAGLPLRESSRWLDVWWFRIARRLRDPHDVSLRTGGGHMLIMFNRDAYWQVAFVIQPGQDAAVRAAGLGAFRRAVARLIPEFADRVLEIQDWDQVKLLSVRAGHLRRWYRPGLICIGDAAHAMAPAGGVGINLAIQDAVAAANLLGPAFRRGGIDEPVLAAIQRRRQWPARVTQLWQNLIQVRMARTALREDDPLLPASVLFLLRLPLLQPLPARMVGGGLRPERFAAPVPGAAAPPV